MTAEHGVIERPTPIQAHGWGADGEAAEVREGEEEDDFWDLFELG